MLRSLGQTADEVAATLRARGVRGVPNTIRYLNPVVRYLQGQVNAVFDINIVDDKLTIRFLDGTRQEEFVPQPVKDFLDAFNRKQYPDLLMP